MRLSSLVRSPLVSLYLACQLSKEVIVGEYMNYFGPKEKNVLEVVLKLWDLEEWSRGGPTAIAPQNVLEKYSHL
jgi:hypothetical protein